MSAGAPGSRWLAAFATLHLAADRSGLDPARRGVATLEGAAREDACTVAFLGEWSRGKSTLLNTILERDLLPTDLRPTTAGLVTMRHGVREHAVALLRSGRSVELPLSTTALRHAQTAESGGLDDASRVDITLRAPDLDGLRLVDTPGVNDLAETARDIVYSILPFVDLAVFVLDATNGGPSASEEAFLSADLLGPLRPPLAFVVNKLDLVEVEEEDELDELREAFTSRLHALVGDDVPVLFGAASGPDRAELRGALLAVLRQAESASVERRRERLVCRARSEMLHLLDERVQSVALDETEIERRLATVDGARSTLPLALAAFRAHARSVGEPPLLRMLAGSLDAHARRTTSEIERRVAMAGDLAAYARHGLVQDVTDASRGWVQGHLAEITTYLHRHLGWLTLEFERNFGSTLGLSGGVRIRIPEPDPLPDIDTRAIDRRQRQADDARYVLPGLLSLAGGLIAVPIGVVGLYVGMKIAADRREAQREALRSELQVTGTRLVCLEEQRLRGACEELISGYFEDLDRQLAASCDRLVEDAQGHWRALLADRQAGQIDRDLEIGRIDAARATLATLDGTAPSA